MKRPLVLALAAASAIGLTSSVYAHQGLIHAASSQEGKSLKRNKLPLTTYSGVINATGPHQRTIEVTTQDNQKLVVYLGGHYQEDNQETDPSIATGDQVTIQGRALKSNFSDEPTQVEAVSLVDKGVTINLHPPLDQTTYTNVVVNLVASNPAEVRVTTPDGPLDVHLSPAFLSAHPLKAGDSISVTGHLRKSPFADLPAQMRAQSVTINGVAYGLNQKEGHVSTK